MKRLLVVLMVCLFATSMVLADVTVTFQANTSMVRSIVDTLGYVDVRGSLQGWTGDIDIMNNIGGDYWELDWVFTDAEVGTEVQFKFGGGIVSSTGDTTSLWENDLPGAEYLDNRVFTVPDADTVLQMAYVGHPYGVVPFEDDPDSLDVYFRVNMEHWIDQNLFDPAEDSVHIAGNLEGWSHSIVMEREGASGYYNAHYKVGPVGTPFDVEFKFTLGDWSGTHESIGNRMATINQDTTIQWKWYNDIAPIVKDHEDTVIVVWEADMTNAIANRGFNIGDTLEVRYGYYGTASEEVSLQMNRKGFSNVYTATDTLLTTIGDELDYQYYIIKRGEEFRENYYNFFYEGTTQGEAERRQAVVTESPMRVQDIADSQNEERRMPLFRNTELLAQDVLVTIECDLRPAIYNVRAGKTLEDIQGDLDITDADEIYDLGVAINGWIWGSWLTWGPSMMLNENAVMHDDGTHGDALAGDTVFTTQILFSPDSSDAVGIEFKFGIGGGDNEGGEGGFGNNHVRNIDDTNPQFTLYTQFGSINPAFYDAWDYDNPPEPKGDTDVERIGNAYQFTLKSNYPNPFNPTTHIVYSLAKASDVKLSVYNVLGKKVATLVSENQAAGEYTVNWNATNDQGMHVSSGFYFYKIEAGDFKQVKKMLLLK